MGYAVPRWFHDFGTERLRRQPRWFGLLLILVGLQGGAFLVLGTGMEGQVASALVQAVASLAALISTWQARKRARDSARAFWFFLSLSLACWFVANAVSAWNFRIGAGFAPGALCVTLYRFYGLPIAMLLLLPAEMEDGFCLSDLLDFLQIGILLVLLYIGFFYLPAQSMTSAQAEYRNLVTFTNAQNLLLAAATLLRYWLTKSQEFRRLLRRLLLFLVGYGVVVAAGNAIDLYHDDRLTAVFDLVWSGFYVFVGILASAWVPEPNLAPGKAEPCSRNFVAHNAALAVLVTAIILLSNQTGGTWHRVGDFVVIVSVTIYAVRLSIAESQRERAAKALQQSERQYRYIFGKSPQPMWVFDAESLRFVDVNDAATQKYGYTREEFLALTILDVRPPEERPAFLRSLKADLATKIRPQGIWKHTKKDGTVMEVEITASLVTFDGRLSVLSLVHDVTAHRLLEEQLRQSQKMEAVGLLAGGIAHDFNNLLNVILGYLQLIPDKPDDAETLARYVSKATDATRRASDLVRQLLALSRKQVLWPRVLNLNTVVSELGKMLPRMLGENIEIAVQEADDLGHIKVDESQIEQVVLNIAVNARDAMPDGGKLAISTRNHTVHPDEPLAHTMPPGPYVLLKITDSGTGMDVKTLSHIFEPFFTTKPKGKGSGLGLAIVYGIVTQSGGFLHVTSAPGQGTSFEIFFPRVSGAIEAAHGRDAESARVEKEKLQSTILLVEDEDALRDATFEYLTHTGCHVLTAHDGSEALAVLKQSTDPVGVLVTDVVMPKMGGDELAREVRVLYPKIKIIFVSGYNDELVSRIGVLDSATAFLPKPYTFRDLAKKIREAANAHSS